jgi:hypothetical protein
MTQLGPRCLARLAVGLLVALLLGELLSPSAARAGCGDHVQIPRALVVPIDDPADLPAHPAAPCTGAACSLPEQIPLAPVAPSPTLTDLWGQVASTSDGNRPSPSGWLSLSDTPPSQSLATSIFHPPR